MIDIYFEVGKKRTFAAVLEWPGWCRSGHDEDTARQALFELGPRYARVLNAAQIAFEPPANEADFAVVERLEGNTTTDFGAPDGTPAGDRRPVDEAELKRLQALLQACWHGFDAAVAAAAGKELRRGPRGGGRDLAAITQHVLGAEQGYVGRLAWKRERRAAADPSDERDQIRQTALDALAAAARGETPTRGPRGGIVWTPRYFVRRVAWHVLDHLWEIEDRVL